MHAPHTHAVCSWHSAVPTQAANCSGCKPQSYGHGFSRQLRARVCREVDAQPRARALTSSRLLLPVGLSDGSPPCASNFILISFLLCTSQGVLLSLFFAFTSTPCDNKTSTTSKLHVAAAVCNGVVILAVSRMGSALLFSNVWARRPRAFHGSGRLASMCKADHPTGMCCGAPGVTASKSAASNNGLPTDR